MKDYYEILEVSKNASKEIIEKAYKVLAKKYHPDLQEQSKKQEAEQKMKLINEAYEVLSDDEKRKNYDIELERKKIEQERIEQQKNNITYTQNINKQEDTNTYVEEVPYTKEQMKQQIKQEKRAQREYQEEQDRIYRNYMRSLGYRVKERWTLKKFKRLLITILTIIIAILIIWFFPPTHKLLVQIYEENQIIKAIIDVIINIVKGLWNGIITFIKSIFTK